jgi:hypothetical protein
MPARTRVIVIAMLWFFAGASAIGLAMTEHGLAAAITVVAGLGGTAMILRWRRQPTAG